jgi:hypothetical protein
MNKVNNIKRLVRLAAAVSAGFICLMPVAQSVAADKDSSLPPVIEIGLNLWVKFACDRIIVMINKGLVCENLNYAPSVEGCGFGSR